MLNIFKEMIMLQIILTQIFFLDFLFLFGKTHCEETVFCERIHQIIIHFSVIKEKYFFR